MDHAHCHNGEDRRSVGVKQPKNKYVWYTWKIMHLLCPFVPGHLQRLHEPRVLHCFHTQVDSPRAMVAALHVRCYKLSSGKQLSAYCSQHARVHKKKVTLDVCQGLKCSKGTTVGKLHRRPGYLLPMTIKMWNIRTFVTWKRDSHFDFFHPAFSNLPNSGNQYFFTRESSKIFFG